jgi:hypothetical protein
MDLRTSDFYFSKAVFPKLFFFLPADPFWLRKITTDPHILAQVNIEGPDDWYPKLKICISDPILESYIYILAAYVTIH